MALRGVGPHDDDPGTEKKACDVGPHDGDPGGEGEGAGRAGKRSRKLIVLCKMPPDVQ